ncbi:hypothetical protein BG262_06030 [Floricoccus penangensis]|uniref:Tyr recombinase domain-containing protein n=1 Tax=Floricoccus penangensis TaxID=1859475 RepID=A0A9Q5JFH7_9LACT|nr:tyrosine-type recombinase/integrase [Floricoccus penangensis]OFI46041.1 hypothetical protein BG262_06030 [Floricoccus penangensis]
MAYPIKYIENNLVFNHDGECFAYYELIPYNYSFLIPDEKYQVHDNFRQLVAQNRDGKIHALRHSHASLLISMGENPLIIKERLGHEDIETTLGTYGHLYPNSNFEVASKLNGIISFQPAEQNLDSSPKNQFTVNYRQNKQPNSAIKVQ